MPAGTRLPLVAWTRSIRIFIMAVDSVDRQLR
jgi:hypothetical protein